MLLSLTGKFISNDVATAQIQKFQSSLGKVNTPSFSQHEQIDTCLLLRTLSAVQYLHGKVWGRNEWMLFGFGVSNVIGLPKMQLVEFKTT